MKTYDIICSLQIKRFAFSLRGGGITYESTEQTYIIA